jgi:signal transduction histidine kinase
MPPDNATRWAEVQERLQHAESLLTASEVISSTLELPEVARRTIRELVRYLGADFGTAWLVDPDGERLTFLAGYRVPKQLARAATVPILRGHPLLERVMQTQESIYSSDSQADPTFEYPLLKAVAHKSVLVCPISSKLPGAFVITWTRAVHRFTAAEVRFAEGIVRHAALAAEHARLHEELQQRLQQNEMRVVNARLVGELKTRHTRLEALLEVNRQLSRIQPLGSLLASIAEACGRLLGSDAVGIRLVEGDELVLAAAWGDAKQIMAEPRVKFGEAVSGRVAASGEALVISDPEHDARLAPPDRARCRGLGYRAWLAAPVTMGERLVGVLSILTKQSAGFSREDLATVTAFASQAAVTLDNARLYQQVQRAYDELSRTQNQLTQSQKMEAVGRLAGGVAHDFNNLLLVIMGQAHFLLNVPADGDGVRRRAAEIQDAADRAATLTRQLLAFSRRQILRPEVLDLNALVSDATKMLKRLIGEDISLDTVPAVTVGSVRADPGQIEQALMNLVVNARDAMPQGGAITIETADAELDEDFVRRHPGAQPGPYMRVSVSDTGCGMSAEIQSRVFEPFFTTKEPGKGTGLGLSTVYGIVKQHGGYIAVHSAPGQGTAFTIYLPRVEAAAELPAPLSAATLPRGSERILLVEDESAVLALVHQVLTQAGYTLIEAATPDQALKLSAECDDPIHLLLTDVILPDMSGPKLVQRLAATRPSMKVLYMSGYPEDALGPHGALDAGTAFIQKPFRPEALASKVREVLDQPAELIRPSRV